MTTKSDVSTFINKVERKALFSVTSRYNNSVEEEIQKLLYDDLGLKNDLLIAQDIFNDLRILLDRIHARINNLGNLNSRVWDYGIKELVREVVQPYYDNLTLRAFRNITPNTPELVAIKEAYETEKRKVELSYQAVKDNTSKMLGPKAVKYLASLGFDVTWFDEDREVEKPAIKEVDTKQLFVCGDNS